MKFTRILSIAIFVCMSSLSSEAGARTLNGYSEVLDALKSGKSVHALIDYRKCTTKEDPTGTYGIDEFSAGFNMDRYFELAKKRDDGKYLHYVVYAQNNWGDNHSNYVLAKQLINLWEDNSVDIIMDIVDPITYKLKDRGWAVCSANKDGGAVFVS